MATSAQIYGSAALGKRCFFVRSNRHLNFSPLLSSRVSLRTNQTLLGSNISACKFKPRKSLRNSAFDANTAVQYTEDQNSNSDSKFKEDSNSNLVQVNENIVLDKEIDSAPKKHAKIHDFCLGIPFGLFIFATGIIGFLLRKSSESFLFGIAPGFAIFGLGVTSLNVWKKGISSVPFIFAQTAIAAVLVWKYIQTFSLTKNLLPWGIYGFVSVSMICFYLYVLISGGNPPPKKPAAPSLQN